ncbi:MAG: PBECR4 domain-containing protein [Clostridiales bacterium]|nr:PBECR4 domain-containing protein [Clostridiales bacterium]
MHFYEKCIKKRLTENDFSLAKNGSTVQKLDVLENMMLLKKYYYDRRIH